MQLTLSEELLDIYPDLEDLLEVLDLTPLEVVDILIKHGYAKVPEFLER